MGIISILGAADCDEPGDTICEIREKKSETDWSSRLISFFSSSPNDWSTIFFLYLFVDNVNWFQSLMRNFCFLIHNWQRSINIDTWSSENSRRRDVTRSESVEAVDLVMWQSLFEIPVSLVSFFKKSLLSQFLIIHNLWSSKHSLNSFSFYFNQKALLQKIKINKKLLKRLQVLIYTHFILLVQAAQDSVDINIKNSQLAAQKLSIKKLWRSIEKSGDKRVGIAI